MLDRAARLLAAAAPELRGVPIYLVAQSGTAFADSYLSAFTHPNLDWWLKDHLGDRWRGRGIAAIVNDTPGGLASEVPAAMLPDRVACTAVHEVGHAAADGWGLTRAAAGEPHEEEKAKARIMVPVAAKVVADRQPQSDGEIVRGFTTHGARWIRATLHLRRRIEAEGVYLPPCVCVHGPFLSPGWVYDGALGDEPERLAGRPLAEILDSPPPPEFAAEWERDRAEFYVNNGGASVRA